MLEERFTAENQRFSRTVALEPAFTKVLPELVFDLTWAFAEIAARALRLHEDPDIEPEPEHIDTVHIYTPATTIAAEEATLLAKLGESGGQLSFAEACADAASREVVAVRFLAVLELYKEGKLAVEQGQALGPITLRLESPATAHREGETE